MNHWMWLTSQTGFESLYFRFHNSQRANGSNNRCSSQGNGCIERSSGRQGS